MSEARVNNLSNESNTGGPTITGITTFSGTNYFVPSVGNTAQRPDNPQKGELRFNTDTKHLEYYKGDTIGWSEIEASHGQLGGGTGSNAGTGARGVTLGGHTGGGTRSDVIDYITTSTLGNATDFGNLTSAKSNVAAFGSRTRGIASCGFHATSPNDKDDIEYITYSSTGDAIDFGNSTAAKRAVSGCSSNTRGLTMGGFTSPSPTPAGQTDVIDYITIAATGNAVDFGNLSAVHMASAVCASSTRGIFVAGQAGPAFPNTIEYVTIATTGNTTDFGDRTFVGAYGAACSNSTRGLMAGGGPSPGYKSNTINYITIATLGNAADFGDLTGADGFFGASATPTRGIFSGGYRGSPLGIHNIIEYVQILTTGNAVDFGDLTVDRNNTAFVTNAHGGL